MPIKIPANLPAKETLIKENVSVMDETTAQRQDIRPLRIILLNLMPEKITTETQIARVLGASPLQIELTLLRTGTYTGTHTPEDHLFGFYQVLDDIKDHFFDGIIFTGAPLGQMHYEDVDYWPELQTIFDWSTSHCYSQFFLCWGALAGLYHFNNITKSVSEEKNFGVFPYHRTDFTHPLTRGFDDIVHIPVSRYSQIDETALQNAQNITHLLSSPSHGTGLVVNDQKRQVFMFNHLEYDRETLKNEYDRDHAKGVETQTPQNYYPNDDTTAQPIMNWRAHRNLLFMNWINMVYQGTPYNLDDLKNPLKIDNWN